MQFFKKSISKSRICNWLIIFCIASINYNHKDWQEPSKVIHNDVIGYYLYLPAVFIYNDIHLGFLGTADEEVKLKVWYRNAPNGGKVGKMSCGLAMLLAPCFLVAHCYTTFFSDYPANGYSPPYCAGIIASAVLFLGLGLYYLRKTLNLYFPEFITMLVCITLVFGTNIYYYSIYVVGLTHIFNFALLIAFVYYSILWNETKTIKRSIGLGVLIGLISLTRPSNIIIALFLFFWNVKSFKDVQEKMKLWLVDYKYLVLIAVFAFLIWIPQLIYWKEITGDLFYYSYEEERFFFNNPIIIKGLFGYRKGWLLYTPVMCFSLIGIAYLRKKLSAFFLPTLLFVVLNIYIILSWWCWWYGGSFGARSFIDCYGLLAIPMAALFYAIWNKNKFLFGGFLTIVLAFTLLNRFQIEQYYTGAIHWDAMSKEAYWANFGKLYPVQNFQELIIPPDYAAEAKGIR